MIDDLAKVETYYYTYDKMHRLTSETTSTGSVGVIPAILEMRYEDPDHIHAVSSVLHKGVTHDYVYDLNGNMENGPDLTDPMAVVSRNLAFNADNMPVTVAHPTGGTVSLIYDGESKRAGKSGAGKVSYYFSNTMELIDNVENFYVFAGNLRVAVVKGGTPTYFHKDHLGSSSAMTDVSGNIIETAMYMPFGGKRGDGDGISVSSYKFTDQELDAESGLYNYDARLYDPLIGRFLSADSIVPGWTNPQSFNRYSYCLNNPLVYVDPDGHEGEGTNDKDSEPDINTSEKDDQSGETKDSKQEDPNDISKTLLKQHLKLTEELKKYKKEVKSEKKKIGVLSKIANWILKAIGFYETEQKTTKAIEATNKTAMEQTAAWQACADYIAGKTRGKEGWEACAKGLYDYNETFKNESKPAVQDMAKDLMTYTNPLAGATK